ncbi:Uncharacterized protein dnm_093320 [Desulfonema magnum]|uniref:Uncharacterized protein n=1 Tax=Desulfonema magnum TaxID=45655 RepID=A0A975BWV7_9BACT|nr:Uncharacterized protein dnm_093320 [Desulfonema magnum]
MLSVLSLMCYSIIRFFDPNRPVIPAFAGMTEQNLIIER